MRSQDEDENADNDEEVASMSRFDLTRRRFSNQARVMKRVMKRFHHHSIANAPISTEIKRSSPPRLLPQAEGNFRQQHYWRLVAAPLTLRFSPVSTWNRTNYPQPALALLQALPTVRLSGSLPLRAWGRTGALRHGLKLQETTNRETRRNKKGSPYQGDPENLTVALFPKIFFRHDLGMFVRRFDFTVPIPEQMRFDNLAQVFRQLIEQPIAPIDVNQCYARISFYIPDKLLHRKVLRNVSRNIATHKQNAPCGLTYCDLEVRNFGRTNANSTENLHPVKRQVEKS